MNRPLSGEPGLSSWVSTTSLVMPPREAQNFPAPAASGDDGALFCDHGDAMPLSIDEDIGHDSIGEVEVGDGVFGELVEQSLLVSYPRAKNSGDAFLLFLIVVQDSVRPES